MKRIGLILMLALFLCGCSVQSGNMDRAITLRGRLQKSPVAFSVDIIADYGNKYHAFSMECQSDTLGNLEFTVAQPENISGISGIIAENSGKLTFEEQILAFDILADGLISPVSGPWVMMETLRGGYLTSCSRDGEFVRLAIDDSYAEKALHLEIWLDETDIPRQCEIYWQGRRLLTMTVRNFRYL